MKVSGLNFLCRDTTKIQRPMEKFGPFMKRGDYDCNLAFQEIILLLPSNVRPGMSFHISVKQGATRWGSTGSIPIVPGGRSSGPFQLRISASELRSCKSEM
jgi:hypothetical protein